MIQKRHNWFLTHIEYQGHGKAKFEDPKGILEGHVLIRFDEFGNYIVEMDVENCKPDQPLQFDLLEFFSAEKPIKENGEIEFTPNLGSNKCISLIVETSDGIYSTTRNIIYNPIISFSSNNQSKVVFYIAKSQFDVKQERVPSYWVMPLFNFVSEFQQRNSQLDNHPLRIRPRQDDMQNTTSLAERRKLLFSRNLITFTFKNNLGFIQPLLDFSKRKNILYSGQSQCVITAVMICEVDCQSIDIENLNTWLPLGFLSLLSLATGTEVTSPWVEFRDVNGEIVKRIHRNFVKPTFSKGHTTISEVTHQGTGCLLTCAQSSPHYCKQPLGSVLSDLVQSSSGNFTIEDKLNKICRAFDYLCKYYNLDTQNLLLELDSNNQKFVKNTLQSAAKNIRDIAKTTTDPQQSKLLKKIADKTINASNKDRDFGLAVTDLLKRLGLHDEAIINSHYQSNPRNDGTQHWSGVISNYRGIVVHKGDFGFQVGTYDVHDVVRITHHLHDILVRIVFQMLGYNGTYQPTMIRVPVKKPVDWVKSNLSAKELGY